MKAFKSPERFLAHLDAEAVAAIASSAADLALIVDAGGVIRDCACASQELADDIGDSGAWIGRPWADTVTTDSRAKLATILREGAGRTGRRWRQLAYPSPRGGLPRPMLFCAVPTGQEQRLVALGRDLQPVSALQQQLIDAQQSMERDYARLRHVETRYRLLFLMSSEPVLIVDVTSQRIVEYNPAAARLLNLGRRPARQAFLEAFTGDGGRSVQTLLTNVKATGQAASAQAALAGGMGVAEVAVSLLRQDDTATFLVRLGVGGAAGSDRLPAGDVLMLALARQAPDGLVVTDPQGLILTANDAFLAMAQLASLEQTRAESIERWLGRSGVDLSVLIANLRQRGSVRLFATTLRAEHGVQSDVEISAVSLANGDQRSLGFVIRGVGGRLRGEAIALRDGPRSVEQLSELIGRVSLKQLTREATEVLERLAIEAALRLTDDNRASAAEILGLSRQSLYVKLRRYGLADGFAAEDDA